MTTEHGSGGDAQAEVHSIQTEIEECSDRLRDLVAQFEALRGDLTAATAAADNGDGTATLLERMAQYRIWAEQRLTELTGRLHDFTDKYGEGAEVVQAVLQAYTRLSQLVSSCAAELHRASLAARDKTMESTASLTGGVADEARRQAASAAEAAEDGVRLAQEWGDKQVAMLRATLERTWQRFPEGARQRAEKAHGDVSMTIDALTGKLHEYRSMPDTVAMRRALARDAESAMQRAQWHVRRTFPVMGYTIDGTAEILSDPSRSLAARLWALALFILITFFHWARHQAHRIRDAAFGDPSRVPAHSACHS